MRFFMLFILIAFCAEVSAGGQHKIIGATQNGMVGVSATHIDAFAPFNNMAAAAFLQKHSVGLYYNNRYIIPSINDMDASYTFSKDKLGAFSAQLSYFGYSAYNESKAGFGYARQFSGKVSVGLAFNYHLLHIENNGNKSMVSFNVGMLYKPIEKVRIGFTVYNPVRQKIEEYYKETLSTNFKLACSYHPSNKLMIGMEAEKDLINRLQVKLGAAYDLHEYLSLRLGAATMPTLFSGGIGTHFKNIYFDAACSWDLNLGASPQFSIQYLIK